MARCAELQEMTMFRKLSLAAAAAVSLGVAALAPNSASAWGGGWHGGYHPGFHAGFYHRGWDWGYGPRFYVGGPAYYGAGYGGCYVRRLVPTPWGPRWRLVNRCY
jgi:hypothetical protein